MSSDAEEGSVVAAADVLKALADKLAAMLDGRTIPAETPAQQLLGRQLVYLVRQVHCVAFLAGWPFYAEQAGQLVRGLTEVARIVLWLVATDDPLERQRRVLAFWSDGLVQTRSKYEYQASAGVEIDEAAWSQLDSQEALLAEQVSEMDGELGGLPNAIEMWEGLGRKDLYGLFRWESDPAHGSAVTLGTVVSDPTDDHVALGGPNRPVDRARRLGAALLLLQLTGSAIIDRYRPNGTPARLRRR